MGRSVDHDSLRSRHQVCPLTLNHWNGRSSARGVTSMDSGGLNDSVYSTGMSAREIGSCLIAIVGSIFRLRIGGRVINRWVPFNSWRALADQAVIVRRWSLTPWPLI